jgi:hypothetical protein
MSKQNKRFKDIIEGYQGEINVSINKNEFINIAKKEYLHLLRGNLIARYELLEKPSEYCPVSIDKRGHYLKERISFQEVSNQQQTRRIKAIIIGKNILCGHTTNYCFPKDKKTDLRFLLALLNSRLVNYYFKYFNKTNHVPIGEIKNIPFPEVKAMQRKQLADKAKSIERTYKDYSKVKTKPTSETERLKRQIEEADKEIDEIVYKLYGLTEEEIKVVEGVK